MKVCVIGGGASGMLAAALLSERGCAVDLYEKNEKLGKKLFITGKGRCNLTNDCTEETFFDSVSTNSKFLFSAYRSFSAQDTMDLFSSWGLALKTERGSRVFPVSDHAYDVTDMLKRRLKAGRVRIFLNSRVCEILVSGERAAGIRVRTGSAGGRDSDAGRRREPQTFFYDRVIVATGGLSYPSTGACGDGMEFARSLGIRVEACAPSLVSMNCRDACCPAMQGLSLKNVELSARSGKKTVFREFGEMMFTHYGITGPIVLKASSRLGHRITECGVSLDLKPAITREELDAKWIRMIREAPGKRIGVCVKPVFPSSLSAWVLQAAQIDPEKRAGELTKEERIRLTETVRTFPLHVASLRGYDEAVVTKGGVSVRELDPSTMESRRIRGLYFIGEVIDVDALTGGFNLQIAWSTAHAAAVSCAADAERR